MKEKRISEIYFRDDGSISIFYPPIMEIIDNGFYLADYNFVRFDQMDTILIFKNQLERITHVYNSVYTFRETTDEYVQKIKNDYMIAFKNWIADTDESVNDFKRLIERQISGMQKRIEKINLTQEIHRI